MAKDNKTISLFDLPQLNEINDTDVFILTDGNVTHKITGYDLMLYIKNHSDISKFFVHQDTVGKPNGIAALDTNSKIFSDNILFGNAKGYVFDGGEGKALSDALISHKTDVNNPHNITKSQIELDNVDNTSDVDKPVSTLQQAAIEEACSNAKEYADTIVADLIDGAPEAMNTLNEIVSAFTEHQEISNTLNAAIGKKVDKVDGKQLSSNDFTDEEKTKLRTIENSANYYVHPNSDGSKHIPPNGTENGGKYLKATANSGVYEWDTLTKEDVTKALGYTPGGNSVTYQLLKSGSKILLSGSDGSETSVNDSNTTYTLSDFGITATPSKINFISSVTSDIQTQLNGKASNSHTHNYAGAASAGGAAIKALNDENGNSIKNEMISASEPTTQKVGDYWLQEFQ